MLLPCHARLTATLLLASTSRLPRCSVPPRASLFPDDDDAAVPAPAAGPMLSRDKAFGFWTIYDELAANDALNAMANGGTPSSMVSASIILRADGQTSRGCDFPGGEWTLSNEPEAGRGDETRRWRMRITLRSRLLREEWRYEGLFFGMEQQIVSSTAAGGGAAAVAASKLELRVVGQATRWDTSGDAPKQIGDAGFSMVKQELDHSKLTPTIQTFSAPASVDPEELRLQAEWRKRREQTDEDDLRTAIEEVRRAKADDPYNWKESIRLREGVDFWPLGEEPDVTDAGEGEAGDETP